MPISSRKETEARTLLTESKAIFIDRSLPATDLPQCDQALKKWKFLTECLGLEKPLKRPASQVLVHRDAVLPAYSS
jgi:hypothetical protein